MRFLFLFLFGCGSAIAQTLPPDFQSDWHNAGIEGSFANPAVTLDIGFYGGIANDGLADDVALAAAINAASGLSAIYFPTGTYNFASPIAVPDSIILKGAGPDSTHFVFDLSNAQLNCINLWGGASGVFHPLLSGYTKGNNYVTCAQASNFNTDDYIEIRQLNGSWDTNPAFWAQYAVGHMSRVTAISGDTIFLADPLRIDFDSGLSPEIQKLLPVKNAAVECISLARIDSLAPGINYGIYLYNAWNCRVKGVYSYKSIGAHIIAEVAAHCEILDCFFQEAYTYDGNNTRGYGVIMSVHSCANKIENCVFRKLRHAMMVKQGANGNVFGYNYSRETIRTEFPTNASGDISVHGHYPFANLFEGNICRNLSIDQAWGPSGPRNVFFRNRVEYYGFVMSSGTVQSDSQAVIGNTIPSTAALTGLYLFSGAGHFTYGNLVQGVIQPPGTSVLPDSSCYLNSVPAFWQISAAFPSIGTGSGGGEINPAKDRWNTGEPLAFCSSVSTGLAEQNVRNDAILSYRDNRLLIDFKGQTYTGYEICDLAGRKIQAGNFEDNISQSSLEFSAAPGIYICILRGKMTAEAGLFEVN